MTAQIEATETHQQLIQSFETSLDYLTSPNSAQNQKAYRCAQLYLSTLRTQLDHKKYLSICEKLKQLRSTNQENDNIQKLYEKALEPISESGYSSYLSYVSSFSQNLYSYMSDWFIDGQHQWKKIRYYLSLQAILKAFQKEKSKRLLEQLQQEQSPQLENIQNVFNSLNQLENNNELLRDTHSSFIQNLREALDSETFNDSLVTQDDPATNALLDLCHYRFTEVHLYAFCEEFITACLEKGLETLFFDDPESNAQLLLDDPFTLPLDKQFKAINALPQDWKAPKLNLLLHRARGACNILYNPHQDGNTPYVLFDVSLQQGNNPPLQIRVIRTGTPTVQRDCFQRMTYAGEAYIVPEFRYFIERLRRNDENLLFISFQDDLERWIANEAQRNIALKKLAEEYPETFRFAIFSKDNAFYFQTSYFNRVYKKEEFLNIYFNDLIHCKNGMYIPTEWAKNKELTSLIKENLFDVSFILFKDANELKKVERLDFIEISYCFLTLEFALYFKVLHLIFCCKDSIDRANLSNTLLLYILLIITGDIDSLEYRKILYSYLHAATLFVKKREMNSRFERLISAIKRLDDPAVRKRIKEWAFKKKLRVDPIIVKKLLDQLRSFEPH